MKTVTIYLTPTSLFCKALKEFLRAKNVPYADYDVISMPDKLEEMKRLSGGATSVPVIVFEKEKKGQTVQIGFNEEAVSKELGL